MSFIQLLAAMGSFQETTPPVGAPDPPTNLSAVDQSTCSSCSFDGQVYLTWTNGDTEQTRIYRDSVLQHTVSAGVSNWTDTDAALAEDTTYIYEVCHYNGSLESTRDSDSMNTNNVCKDALTAPTVSAAADSTSQITITCSNGGTDVVSYDVHLSDGTYLGNTGASPFTFAHTPLSAGTQYTYKAKARSADGCLSGYGATDSAYTDLATPSAPTVVEQGPNDMRVTCPAYGTGADRYRIFYAGGAEVGTITSPTLTFDDPNTLTPGTEYSYEIRAEDSGGNAGNSAKSASASDFTMNGTISSLAAVHSTADCPTASIDLTWAVGDNTDNTIKVERQLPSEGDYNVTPIAAALAAGTTSFEDTTHNELAGTGTTYYRVSFNGITGGTADTDSVTVDCRPDEPFGSDVAFASGEGTDDVDVTWNDASSVPAETGFKIYRAPDSGGLPGTWVLVDTVGAGIETYNDFGFGIGTFHWSVASYNATGESDKNECISNPLTITEEEA